MYTGLYCSSDPSLWVTKMNQNGHEMISGVGNKKIKNNCATKMSFFKV